MSNPSGIVHLRRSYHDSPYTEDALSILPGWMKMRERDSLGWRLINSVLGQEVDGTRILLRDIEDSFGLDSPDIKEIRELYSNTFVTTESGIDKKVSVDATPDADRHHIIPNNTISVGGAGISPYQVESTREFTNKYPTRMSYSYDDDTIIDYDITGLGFTKDWYKLDDDDLETIEKQNVVTVNTASGTLYYDTSYTLLDTVDYSIMNQDYDHTGKYEVILDPSGYILEYNPIVDTVTVYDYINVDPSGNAQVITDTYYTLTSTTDSDYVTTTTIVMDGTNPYNGRSIEHSNYFIEYQYKVFTHPKQLTTSKSKFGVQVMNSPPIYTNSPYNYNGTVVDIEIGESTYTDGILLRAKPDVVRPGAECDVVYNYVGVSDIAWLADTDLIHDISDDVNYVGVDSNAVRVIYDNLDITNYYTPTVSGSIIGIGHNDEPTYSMTPPYVVRVSYVASKEYDDVVGVASLSDIVGVDDPYPYDYMLDGDYIIPYTMFPIPETDEYILSSLYTSSSDDFEVTTTLDFTGIAHDQDKSCYWIVEKNNLVLYKISPSDGSVLGKWNIFKRNNTLFSEYKTVVSGVIDIDQGTTLNYHLLSHSRDATNRTVEGILYYGDFLYLLSYSDEETIDGVTVGGDGIWRLDTYNDRVMDIEYFTDTKTEKYPHFDIVNDIPGTGICGGNTPVDITMNDDGHLLLGGGRYISKVRPHYDYMIINSPGNSVVGTIYYREEYDGVEIDGVVEAI